VPLTDAVRGGDLACWAGHLCLEYGVMVDGGDRRSGHPMAV